MNNNINNNFHYNMNNNINNNFHYNMNNNFNNNMNNNFYYNMNIINMNTGINFNNIFNQNELGTKTLYKTILNLDNDYFIVTSIKYIKRNINNINNMIYYFYLSLFDYKTMEEINKIEIEKIEMEINEFSSDNCIFNINLKENIISINIRISLNTYSYSYEFKDNELQLKKNY